MVHLIKTRRLAWLLSSLLVFTAMTVTASAAFEEDPGGAPNTAFRQSASDTLQAAQPDNESEDRLASPKALDDAVTQFVTRFYLECLDREPDPEGLAGWVNGLRNGWVTGGELARGFILSPEFLGRGLSNEDFLSVLYRAFFDRTPDLEGFNGWLSALEQGMSRESVLEGFVHSAEFGELCRRYGIPPYRMDPIEAFVTRFYHECLNRTPDAPGLAGWVNGLRNGWVTGGELARGFVLSPEFLGRGLSNEDFLSVLYRAFFDRMPDPPGYAGWLSALEQGMSRATALESFILSEEFAALCAGYGIIAAREENIDNDGDGYTESSGDCNDRDAGIHPGAAEICGDGIDQDCSGTDLPCTAPPEQCVDISGSWSVSEQGSIKCCIDGYCETETISGTEMVYIVQKDCNIRYEIDVPGYGSFERTGVITGRDVRITGMLALLDNGCRIDRNSVDLRGRIDGNQIRLNGSGVLSGSCDGETFICTANSTAVFTRSGMSSLSDGGSDNAPSDLFPSGLLGKEMRIISAISH